MKNNKAKLKIILIPAVLFITFFFVGAHSAYADYYKTGSLVSTNLLAGNTDVGAITQFVASTTIAAGETVSVQFSRNKLVWYDSANTAHASSSLANGANTLDISALNWAGPVFYYKLLFTTNNTANTATVTEVNVDYTQVAGPIYDYYLEGTLVSVNLLDGLTNVGAITGFSATAAIAAGETLKVQFSRDKLTWYDSANTAWAEDSLVNGPNTISLSALNWSGPLIYYKLHFTTADPGITPTITLAAVDYSGGSGTVAYKQGTLVSTNLLAGGGTLAGNELFGYNISSLPTGAAVTVQFSTSTDGTWYGSNGALWGSDSLSSGSHFTDATAISLSAIPGLTGSSFYYKFQFTNTDPATTPAVTEIRLFSPGGNPATVTTQAVSDIDLHTATGYGNVTSDGNADITERGVVWGTSGSPTTADSKATASGTTGAFTASMIGLTKSTLYYVRAFATNSKGTSYGSEVTFTTLTAKTTIKAPNNLGLVGYWKFDEDRGTQAGDSSGQGNTGTITGATWTAGKHGKALSFNGSSNYIDVGSSASLQTIPFTYTAWIYPLGSGDRAIIGGLSNDHIEFRVNNDQTLQLLKQGISAVAGSGLSVVNGRWNFVAVTYSATGNISWYIDSNLDPYSPTELVSFTNSNTRIGLGYTGEYFNGKLDDVRIYNRALLAGEVAKLYKSGAVKINASSADLDNGSTLGSGLVGLWTFDGNDTNWTSATTGTVIDRSGSNNTGTLTNMNQKTSPIAGKLGQGFMFDGSDDAVYITDSIGTGTVTLCAWIYPTVVNAYEAAISNARTTLGINAAGNRLYFTSNSSSGAGLLSTTNSITVNTWQHVCGVRNSGTNGPATIYINGAFNATGNSNTPVTGFGLAIGNDQFNTYPWPGKLDEVRIYNRALTASEVKQLYNMGNVKIISH